MTTKPNAYESEIDTQLADLYGQAQKAASYIRSSANSLASALGYKRGDKIPLTSELLIEAEANDHPNVRTTVRSIERLSAELAAIREQEKPLEAKYNERRWSRFFLCTAHGGHIHSTMSCSTTYASTEFSWLPELSGLTEAEAVEEYGAILCTVCYPTAPVEWTAGVNKKVAAEKAARDEAKAARAAEKAAKAITAPDGSRLVIDGWNHIATLVTAQRELVNALTEVKVWDTMYADHANYQDVRGKYSANAMLLAEAIAAKTGTPVEQVTAEAQAKADKKFKKDYS